MLLVYWSTQKNLSQLRKINNKFSFEPLYFKKLIYFHVSISQLFESHEVNLWNSYGLLRLFLFLIAFRVCLSGLAEQYCGIWRQRRSLVALH